MKKLFTMVVAGFITIGFMTTFVSANIANGQKLYIKKVEEFCGFNGAKFAAKHSQDEWEEIYKNGKFAEEIGKLCPKGAKVFTSDQFKKYLKDLYDFSYEYANDSGKIPSCQGGS